MKVLLVNGSPHKNGCTNRALQEIEAQLDEEGVDSEIFWIGNKPLAGCMGCRYCAKAGKCTFDDTVNEFAEMAREADGFVFGSPVHYAAMSGALTSFMDRLFYSTSGDPTTLRFKPAAGISSARRAGTTATYDQLNKYFGITQMPIVSSRYWNMVHGNTPEQVEQDIEGLQAMRVLARNMAYLLKCIEAGRASGVEQPKTEDTILTNFVR